MKPLSIVVLFALSGCAGWTPLQLAFDEETQIAAKETSVGGARLGLLSSDNHEVCGVDFNLGKGNSNGGGGVATSLVWNNSSRDFYGVQLTTGMNILQGPKGEGERRHLVGAQVAVLGNEASEVDGLQIGGVNIANHAYGAQVGVGNVATHFGGLQTGFWNMATGGVGIQAAVLNHAGEDLDGIQVGLWNTTKSGIQIGLLNFHENGFLPFFPIINFAVR